MCIKTLDGNLPNVKIAIWPIKLQWKATIYAWVWYTVWDYKLKRMHRKPNMIEFGQKKTAVSKTWIQAWTLTVLSPVSVLNDSINTHRLCETLLNTPLPTAAAITVMKPRREKSVCVRETACGIVSISLFRCPIILKQHSQRCWLREKMMSGGQIWHVNN